jgi:hypothetical protein
VGNGKQAGEMLHFSGMLAPDDNNESRRFLFQQNSDETEIFVPTYSLVRQNLRKGEYEHHKHRTLILFCQGILSNSHYGFVVATYGF